MPLDWLVLRRAVAFVPVAADEPVAEHSAADELVAELAAAAVVVVVVAAAAADADAADAAAELQLVAHCVELEPEPELELASEPVAAVLAAVRARVLAFVHCYELPAGLVVGGELD